MTKTETKKYKSWFHVMRMACVMIFGMIGEKYKFKTPVINRGKEICSDLDYEGDEDILNKCLNIGDEMSFEINPGNYKGKIGKEVYELDIQEFVESMIHDAVLDFFSDMRVDMKHWQKYWESVNTEAVAKYIISIK